MITIKLPVQTNILKYQQQQNILFRYIYNRLKENISDIEIRKKIKTLNNISLMDTWLIESAIAKTKQLFSKNSKIIFGGKQNLVKRAEGKITKEEYRQNRLMPLYVVGEKLQHGNRKFILNIIQNNTIVFKPSKGIKISIQLPKLKKHYKDILYKIDEYSNSHPQGTDSGTCYTVELTNTSISISFDESILKQEECKSIPNRIMAFDLNPNFIGYSILDWKSKAEYSIIDKKLISFENCKESKRKWEIYETSKYLSNITKHYKCEYVALEDLSIKHQNLNKGKKINRLVNNQWNRTTFTNNLKKRLNIFGIKVIEIQPQYSSIVGNLLNKELNLPDPINASLEINRRAFLFIGKYIKKNINPTQIIYPSWRKSKPILERSMEENFKDIQVSDWIELFKYLKNSKMRYRVPLEQTCFRVFRLGPVKSQKKIYSFNAG